MLGGLSTAADICCDHGRLACALIQQFGVKKCIAVDVSATSQKKCAALAAYVTPAGTVETRQGDGLIALLPGEAEGIALCGVGGELTVQLLDAAKSPLCGAKIAVFAPMRGEAALRAYLFENGYWIERDRVVADAGRLYQVFSALPPEPGRGRQPLPRSWPEGLFDVGFTALVQREKLLPALLEQKRRELNKRLLQAVGTVGETPLQIRKERLEAAQRLWEEWE